jgi:hypothetical protein
VPQHEPLPFMFARAGGRAAVVGSGGCELVLSGVRAGGRADGIGAVVRTPCSRTAGTVQRSAARTGLDRPLSL